MGDFPIEENFIDRFVRNKTARTQGARRVRAREGAHQPLQDSHPLKNGGGSGIRTLEGREPLLVFKTSAFDHSANPPKNLFAY